MIKAIAGKKGSGKTKRIIKMANEASQNSKQNVVFIDDDNSYMFDLKHEVRFVNAGEYEINDDKMLFGFLAGAVTQNFDIGTILIDAFKKLINIDLSESEWFFQKLEVLSEKHGIDFVLSISEEPSKLPEFISKYLI